MKRIEIDFDKIYEYNFWSGSMGLTKVGVVHHYCVPIDLDLHRDLAGEPTRTIAEDGTTVDDYHSGCFSKKLSDKKAVLKEYAIVIAKGTSGTNYAHEGRPSEREGVSFNQFIEKLEKRYPGFKEKVTNVHGIAYNTNNWG